MQQAIFTHVDWRVELQILVQCRDLINLLLLQVKAAHIQVRLQSSLGGALGDDRNAALRVPAQQHLGRCLAMRIRHLLDHGVFKQRWVV